MARYKVPGLLRWSSLGVNVMGIIYEDGDNDNIKQHRVITPRSRMAFDGPHLLAFLTEMEGQKVHEVGPAADHVQS